MILMTGVVLTPDLPVTSPFLGRQLREARLRPQFAEFYPGVRAGEWMAAAVLADTVLADRLLRGSAVAIRGRVLEEAHFDFRGGVGQGEREGVRR
jgi:hypothetical protein